MNAEHVEEESLQRYFDGELASELAREIALHLEACSSCMARHSALGQLHRVLTWNAAGHMKSVDSDALFASIEKVARERPEPTAAERAEMRWDATPQRPRPVWVPLAGVLAAAAALLLFLKQAPTPAPVASDEPEPSVAEPTTRLSTASSEVEQVDFGSKAGTVFDVVLADDVSTPVIWIDDGDDDDEK